MKTAEFRADWAQRAVRGREIPPRGTKCAACGRDNRGARWRITGLDMWQCPRCYRRGQGGK